MSGYLISLGKSFAGIPRNSCGRVLYFHWIAIFFFLRERELKLFINSAILFGALEFVQTIFFAICSYIMTEILMDGNPHNI